MLLLIALAAGLVVGLLLWQTMIRRQTHSIAPTKAQQHRVAGPDDDPEFLRQLGERLRREGDDPPRRRS